MYGFKYITGHEVPAAWMRRAAATGRVNHAYLLAGEQGIGKNTLARAFAKTLNCETPLQSADEPDACGGCLSCRVFESGNHPDVRYVKGTNTRSIGVDDVREQIVRPMGVKPFRYRYKIFIVDEAETLTPAAQNALLKTIEEPAPYGVFIFLAAHTRAVLPTLLSRCTVFTLRPLPDVLVERALAEFPGVSAIPAETVRSCAAFAGGSIGRALMLAASEDFHDMLALARDILGQIGLMDMPGVFLLYKRVEKWKDNIHSLLDMLYMCCHDELLHRHTNADASLKALFEGMDAINRAKYALRRNGNFQMTIEGLLLCLSRPN
jgi:DNA polymerase-3 subunit delta'